MNHFSICILGLMTFLDNIIHKWTSTLYTFRPHIGPSEKKWEKIARSYIYYNIVPEIFKRLPTVKVKERR